MKAIIVKKDETFIESAKAHKITDAATMGEAAEMLSRVNKLRDSLKEQKEKLTKPINQALKEIRGRYAPAEELLDEAADTLRKSMTVYQTAQTNAATAKVDKLAERVEKGTLRADTAIRKMDEIERPDGEISAASGSVQFRAMKKFEVMDMTLLPIEYHLADEVKIRQEMKDGRELAGVRYYTEQVPVNSR